MYNPYKKCTAVYHRITAFNPNIYKVSVIQSEQIKVWLHRVAHRSVLCSSEWLRLKLYYRDVCPIGGRDMQIQTLGNRCSVSLSIFLIITHINKELLLISQE